MVDEIQSFKWQCSKKIDDEPSLQIMFCYQFPLRDYSPGFLVDVRCTEINEDVKNEEDFDNAISYDELFPVVMCLECDVERHHYCYVAH